MENDSPAKITFADLNLDERLLRAIAAKGYTAPSPIQAQCIPYLLEGRDVLGTAQTGTGKTAAFALPILQLLLRHPRRMPRNCVRALILTPTRELAAQIHRSFLEYGAHTGVHCAVVYGGVGFQPQINALQKGVDVLIATPGRLIDLGERGCLNLDSLAVFVLDEADRMLDMGFQPAVQRIVNEIPEVRQSLLFSATMPSTVRGLAESFLHDPVNVAVAGESATADNIAQQVWHVEGAHKKQLLLHILQEHHTEGLVMVFMRMKHAASKIADFLKKNGIQAEAIHGNKSQNARERALSAFRSGKARVLVATDVASRGIDVKGIELVINYDMPNEAEAYVHRIGRTARAGASGKALSFVEHENRNMLRSIERLISQTIPVQKDHPFSPSKHIPAPPSFQRDSADSRPRSPNRPKTGWQFRKRRSA
ncbi:MAG: DEAD/DEAH box helicase [Puniceicoccales bacterium]|jgi:ATP-dependent RNA helicase RhlE|nr:DEAD/DEAH box helicase [Puniceicoccales bacterium]